MSCRAKRRAGGCTGASNEPRVTPNSARSPTSPSSKAPRTRTSWWSRRRRSATRRSASPTATPSPAWCAATSRRRRGISASSPAPASACRTRTAASTSPGPPTAPPTATSRGCSPRAGWTRRRASAASPATTSLSTRRAWSWRCCRPKRRTTDFAARLSRDAAALRRRLALPLFCAADHRFRGERPQAPRPPGGDGGRGRRPAARRRRRPLPRAGAAPLGRRAGRDPPPHHRRRARLRRRAERRGAPQAEAEMRRLFAGHEDAVDATMRVVAACSLLHGRPVLRVPGRDPGEGPSPQETLRRRAAAACSKRWPGGAPRKMRQQIAHELAADRATRLRALLPDRPRDRPLRGVAEDPLPGPRLGRQLRAVLRARHHLRRAREARPAVRALHLRRARTSRPTSTWTSSTSAARR